MLGTNIKALLVLITSVGLILLKDLFINLLVYLFERKVNTERSKDGMLFHPLAYCPNVCNTWGLTRLKPGACNLLGSPTWVKGLKYFSHLPLLSQDLFRELR